MTFDLSAITDSLTDLVKAHGPTHRYGLNSRRAARGPPTPTFTPNISGIAPDLLHQEDGPQLSLFLYHVEPNNAVESMFWAPQGLSSGAGPGQPVRFLPLALNLYYLMSAFAKDNYHWEQQAMSVAMRIFHANPVMRGPANSPPWELSLTMENRPYNEMSDLWQATTVPMRLSVVYRAAVVLIDPDTLPAAAPDTLEYNVIVEQGTAAAGTVEMLGTFRQASYVAPAGPVFHPVAGDRRARPAGLANGSQADRGADQTLRRRRQQHRHHRLGRRRRLYRNPRCTAGPEHQSPRDRPVPGRGRRGPCGALSLAAYVDPTSGPVLPSAPSINVTGTGFAAGATDVQVGALSIPANQLSVAADGSSLTFPTPSGPSGTVAPINVQVRGIASDPALWVTL